MAKNTDNKAGLVLCEIGSVIEYLIDRGEIERITKIEPAVRYLRERPLPELFVTASGKRYKLTIEEA